ncbi:hypothetical protein VNO77_42140 [Canavalia gladiata]|uniref:Uncharacterized protein n=1 Tax=Canavalia gladiata TaxID=3824 RepID=A0AAN9K3J9_CANGL
MIAYLALLNLGMTMFYLAWLCSLILLKCAASSWHSCDQGTPHPCWDPHPPPVLANVAAMVTPATIEVKKCRRCGALDQGNPINLDCCSVGNSMMVAKDGDV